MATSPYCHSLCFTLFTGPLVDIFVQGQGRTEDCVLWCGPSVRTVKSWREVELDTSLEVNDFSPLSVPFISDLSLVQRSTGRKGRRGSLLFHFCLTSLGIRVTLLQMGLNKTLDLRSNVCGS
jgi:hypothetical protein